MSPLDGTPSGLIISSQALKELAVASGVGQTSMVRDAGSAVTALDAGPATPSSSITLMPLPSA